MMKNLIVVGGTGFLGKHICVAALNAGWAVTAMSRSGLKNVEGIPLSLVSQIQWIKGDVFDINTYKEQLRHADAVVHTMGTIFDSPQYKTILRQRPSLCSLANLAKERIQGANPMEKTSADAGNTGFDRLNRDSAIELAKNFVELATPTKTTESINGDRDMDRRFPFIYISADDWNPLVSHRYIESKREAETALSMMPQIRAVCLRPGFMYEREAGNVASLRNVVKLGDEVMSMIGMPKKAIQVGAVARAAVEALDDSTIEGVVSLEALQKFASMSKDGFQAN